MPFGRKQGGKSERYLTTIRKGRMGRDLEVRRESENLPVVSCTYIVGPHFAIYCKMGTQVFPRLVHGAATGLCVFVAHVKLMAGLGLVILKPPFLSWERRFFYCSV